MNPFEALMRGSTMQDDDSSHPKITAFGEAEVLASMLMEFNYKHEFRPGMIVRQKPQCASLSLYSDNGLAIVVSVLDSPLVETTADSNSPQYRQPMDMIVGSRATKDGSEPKFILWHVDSRRFEPVDGSTL